MTSAQQAGASGAEGAGAAGSGSLSPEQIEERLRAQREALAASVDEFASRIDPRTQAKEAGEHLREQASAKAEHLREQAVAGADRLREQAEAGAGRLREGARRWAEQAEETVGQVKNRLASLAGGGTDPEGGGDTYDPSTRTLGQRVSRLFDDARDGDPASLGIVTVAGLALAGLSVTATVAAVKAFRTRAGRA